MKVVISHKDGMKFNAQTANSNFEIECSVISPLEYFLAGIIACSTSDMVELPKNSGYEVKNLEVSGEAVRNSDFPKKFNELHLVYSFDSGADDVLASRWVMASLETYCSTINTIRDSVKISFDVIHNGVKIKENEKLISGGGSSVDFGSIESCPS